MIKNLTHQNKLILSLLSKGFKPSFHKNLNNQLLIDFTEIKSHFAGLINNTSYNFAYDNKKGPQRSGSKNYKQGQKKQFKKFQQIRPSQRQLRQKQKQQNRSFTPSITDPQLFIDYINNKNRIQDAVKLMNRILNTKNLTKDQFQFNVWKKYSYYVYIVGQKEQQRWLKENGIDVKNKTKPQFQQNQHQQHEEEEQNYQEEENNTVSQTQSKLKSQSQTNQLPDNHKMARLAKAKRLRLQFLSQITQIHQKFNGELHSQNVTKTFNKFVDFYFQKQQWLTLIFSQKVSLIQSLSRYNIKKAKTLFLKKRPSLFMQPRKQVSGLQKETNEYEGSDLLRVMNLMSRLEINDTQFFEKCIDLLYEEVDRMSLLQLEELTFLLGKSHKFVNKDFLVRVRNRFNQLINQFDDLTMIKALHILSSLSMIEKNMNLNSIYFEPLDLVYERMFPVFDGAFMKRIKSKYLSTIASTLRRAQFYDETILNSLINECMNREVYEFSVDESELRSKQPYKTQFSMITIGQLSQVFFCLGSFNYRLAEFMKYFMSILKLVQSSPNPQKYISYPLFSRLLWSMCVLCKEREIQEMIPLLQHFYKNNKQVQPYEATNYYYCYLLLKRKYMLTEIRFENDKIQQYLSGPKHEVQISQIQKQVHTHLLQLGIPSLLQYNLNNIICDIYIPKFHSLQHLIIEIHGFHHFPRNAKRLNGATTLKQKIIENQGYTCFYISLDQWLIAEDKQQFLKDFFNEILIKKNQQKTHSKLLQDSVKTTQNVQKRGRRILQFKRKTQKQTQQIDNNSQQVLKIGNKKQN